MRLMSFAYTTPQILDQSKTVTRRVGWLLAKPGDLLQPVRQVMGRKKGQPIEHLGGPIRIVRVYREPLTRVVDDPDYGRAEMALEGFPAWEPVKFVEFFRKLAGDGFWKFVTRIEFEYTEPKP